MRVRWQVPLLVVSVFAAVSCGSENGSESVVSSSSTLPSAPAVPSTSESAAFVAAVEKLGVDTSAATGLLPAGEATCSYVAAGYSYTETQAEVAGDYLLNSRAGRCCLSGGEPY